MLSNNKSDPLSNISDDKLMMVLGGLINSKEFKRKLDWNRLAFFAAKQRIDQAFFRQCQDVVLGLIGTAIIAADSLRSNGEENTKSKCKVSESLSDSVGHISFDTTITGHSPVVLGRVIDCGGDDCSVITASYALSFSDATLSSGEDSAIEAILDAMAKHEDVDAKELEGQMESHLDRYSDQTIHINDFDIKIGLVDNLNQVDVLKVITAAIEHDLDAIVVLEGVGIKEYDEYMIKDAANFGVMVDILGVNYDRGIYFPEFDCDIEEMISQ